MLRPEHGIAVATGSQMMRPGFDGLVFLKSYIHIYWEPDGLGDGLGLDIY